MRPDKPREPYAGPESGPEPPFPLKLAGPVVKGFGRGSKELGIPTANIPVSGLSVAGHEDLQSGVYFGFAGLEDHRNNDPEAGTTGTGSATATGTSTSGTVHPMVMSLGYNPFYKNSARSVEVHVLSDFAADFYGAELRLSILGFIRPEYDYVSRDALVEDINTDIEVARRSLLRDGWKGYAGDEWLVRFDGERVGT